MYILSETKGRAGEAKVPRAFNTVLELREYLENAKIYHVAAESTEFNSGLEYGGQTLLFAKGDWWVWMLVSQIQAMSVRESATSVFITTKRGVTFKITCEQKPARQPR
jgi:hypothetical protein